MSVSLFLSAQQVERTYQGEIDRTEDQRLEITIKYGTITVLSHDLSTIRYEALVTCTGKDAEKARELSERVDISTTESYSYIHIESLVGKVKRSRIGRFFKEVDPFDKSKVDVQMTLWIPSGMELRANLKYADMVIEADMERLEIDQAHGSTVIQQIIDRMDYTGDFANLTIDSVADLEAQLNFSELAARKVGRMELTSKGSTIDLSSVRQLDVQSVRDELRVTKVETIRSNATMSKSRIDKVGSRAEISLTNGYLEIGTVAMNSESVSIDMKRADVRLQTGHDQFSLYMDLDGTEASFPKEIASSLNKEEYPETGRRSISFESSTDPKITVIGFNGRCDIFTE